MAANLFSVLALAPALLENLESLGYHEMTPIQAQSLPVILGNRDIIAQAKTGSGKTAAFGLGILANIDINNRNTQSLVICPTRELADQVAKEIRRLARSMSNIRIVVLCGGRPLRLQVESLRHGAHIIVATPGRLKDHLDKKHLNVKQLKTLVLDEADRMLDMGFYDEIIEIFQLLPKIKQTLLFSATFPAEIATMSRLILNKPIEIRIDTQEEPASSSIQQAFYQVSAEQKDEALFSLLSHHRITSAIVFCKTKRQCDVVALFLKAQGYQALAIHSDLEQHERDEVLIQFGNQSCSVLVATDVAARGLDIKDVQAVINYDLPSSAEIYVHRIGRSGRAGKTGLAFSLFSAKQQAMLEEIESYLKTPLEKPKKSVMTLQPYEIIKPTMRTFCINGGKKNKMRPGDILGALTGEFGIAGTSIGKIDILDHHSYMAIDRSVSHSTLQKLKEGKIKGRTYKIRPLTV